MVTFIPQSLVEGAVVNTIQGLGVKVTNGEKNSGKYDKKKFKHEIIVLDPKYYKDIVVKGGTLGTGETYMVSKYIYLHLHFFFFF